MTTIIMRAANCSSQTAQWLADLLKEKPGISVAYKELGDAIVCYGWGTDKIDVPTLNPTAGKLDNLAQLVKLNNHGNVRVPPFVCDLCNADFTTMKFPMLARRQRHDGGGFDIMPVMQEEELKWRKAAGASYFTQYIPREDEYRIWVYRRQILAVYRKEMTNPEKYVGIGCNEKDGFKHVYYGEYANFKDMNTILRDSARAVFDLKLDFGGVDVILGKDGKVYILEVNTAPGANGPEAVGLVKLSNKIVRWVNTGYPNQSKQFTFVGINRNED